MHELDLLIVRETLLMEARMSFLNSQQANIGLAPCCHNEYIDQAYYEGSMKVLRARIRLMATRERLERAQCYEECAVTTLECVKREEEFRNGALTRLFRVMTGFLVYLIVIGVYGLTGWFSFIEQDEEHFCRKF